MQEIPTPMIDAYLKHVNVTRWVRDGKGIGGVMRGGRHTQPFSRAAWCLFACLLLLVSSAAERAQASRAGSKKVVFIAGKKSHGPGDHEYELGCRLLQHCLETSPNLRGFRAEVHLNGWPQDTRTLEDADTIVLFSDGADHGEQNHPLLQGDRLAVLGRAMERGAGLVVLHYSLFVPAQRGGTQFLDWVGGYFDYETGNTPNRWYSKIRTAATTPTPNTSRHPIASGLQPFDLREEYYYRMRFSEEDRRHTPILTTSIPGETEPQVVAWATERRNGGRGFAFTGGHFHQNWHVDPVRRMVLNAIVWTARGRVPQGGVDSTLPASETTFVGATTPATTGPIALPTPKGAVNWMTVGNDPGAMRHSPLRQIHRENVKDLETAWVYRSGGAAAGNGSTIECTPLAVDGVLYLTTPSPRIQVVALDAATGRELWRFNPFAQQPRYPVASGGVNRGVTYWSDGKRNGERRILLATADGRLISLDAHTGQPDPRFGKAGAVDLRDALYEEHPGIERMAYGATSPPAIFEDRVIVGLSVSEGPPPGAPGDIRAFDVRTGRELWRFHTVPRPGEFGSETWPKDAWKGRSGVNPWAGLTVDPERGLVLGGTGSAGFDFYGGDRKGDNLFANCTLALDARTGKRVWHFQTLHHDIWDHDLPYPPVLVTVRHHGRRIPAAAQVTKTGYVFLFDRVTGQPLFPVQELPVPPSDIPGEAASPTQPTPLKPPPFARHTLTEDDLTDISPQARAYAREIFRKSRAGRIHLPPSLQGTIILPGFHGGANWSGASFDPNTGLLYVNSNNVANLHHVTPEREGARLPYGHAGYPKFLDQEGYPAIKPPWGVLSAIDLNRGEILWQQVLGEYPELKKRGVPQTGTENFGGTIVTAGGLVFIGGTKDEKFRAFDARTGEVLWEHQLPAGAYATPCTYSVNGRQYVVIAAGGGGKLGTKSGDYFYAFALPERSEKRTGNARR